MVGQISELTTGCSADGKEIVRAVQIVGGPDASVKRTAFPVRQ